jgi:hypothetical protein
LDELGQSHLPDVVEEDYYSILKGRFKAGDTNTYGLFVIYLHERQQKVKNLIIIASHYSSLFDNDPRTPWHEFEDVVVNMKWKGDITKNLTQDLQNYLISSLELDRGYELLQYVKNLQQTKMEALLESLLMKPLSDRNIIIDTDSEYVSQYTIDTVREERDSRKRESSRSGQASGAGREKDIIEVELVLAPVSGTPLLELKAGDVIMVKVTEKGTRGNYYIDFLGTRVDGDIIPTPAEVVDVSKGSDGSYTVLCKLEEDLLGRAIETEQVKIKMYDEYLSSAQMFENVPSAYNPDRNRSFLLIISISGGLMFVLILIFVILWFTDFF